ncbi:MAG: putative glycosyltransferase, partial [Dehalococcoidia bacterium]|nr:putative glycosyltransferase [Dehalococcoidia bacterium]
MRAVKDTVVSALCRLLSLTFSLFMRRASLPSEPKAILIIKPCCIGDLLMATPVIAQVRRAYPKAKLTVAVGPWAAEAIASNPKIDELIDLGSVGQGAQTKVGDYLKSIATLRERKYDICIVLDRSPLVTLLPYLAGIPNRLGIDSGGRGFSLTAKVPALPLRHEAQLYLDTLLPLGISPEHPRLEFFPQEDESLWAEEQVGEFPEPRIAIHPGGGVNPGSTLLGKRWPPERFGELAALLTKNGGSVVLIGGGSDSEAAEVVLSALAKASPALRQSPSTPPF